MKKILYLLNIAFFVSCGNTNSQIIEDVNTEKFHQLIEKGDGIIIDVRTTQEFSSGHIIDATNIDYYSEDFLDKLNIVRKDVPIYVYCRSGGRSSSAANKMEKLGFTKVYNMLGGIGPWQSDGYKIIKSKGGKTLKQPKFTETQLNEILNNNKTVLIDFSTQWCVPCKKMKPVIEEIQRENPNVKVLFIDADANKELVKRYKIKGVPVFIVFKNGAEVFRNVGVITKNDLLKEIH
jgi:thioredoxin